MKLIPRELDKLKLSAAGALAQRRLARGVRLNYPEATALIASQASPSRAAAARAASFAGGPRHASLACCFAR